MYRSSRPLFSCHRTRRDETSLPEHARSHKHPPTGTITSSRVLANVGSWKDFVKCTFGSRKQAGSEVGKVAVKDSSFRRGSEKFTSTALDWLYCSARLRVFTAGIHMTSLSWRCHVIRTGVDVVAVVLCLCDSDMDRHFCISEA